MMIMAENTIPTPNPIPTLNVATEPILVTPTNAAVSAPVSAGPAVNSEAVAGTETAAVDDKQGAGMDGEVMVWEGHYSLKNFIPRLVVFAALGTAWAVLAMRTWPRRSGTEPLNVLILVWGLAMVVYALTLAHQMIQARFGRHYSLTTRRLFVTAGLFHRRRNMMELNKFHDIFIKQTFLQRTLGTGTVVIVSTDKQFPALYLPGVSDPQAVMDTIWHYARAEQEQKAVVVEPA
jgi:hypothetical protein